MKGYLFDLTENVKSILTTCVLSIYREQFHLLHSNSCSKGNCGVNVFLCCILLRVLTEVMMSYMCKM